MIIALAIISWWLLTLLPAVLLFTERGRRWTRAVVMMLCVTSLTGLSGLSGLSGETGPLNPIVFNPSLWIDASASSPQTDGALGLASASSQYASVASNSTLQTGNVDWFIIANANPTTFGADNFIVGKDSLNIGGRDYSLLYDSTNNWSINIGKAVGGNDTVTASTGGSTPATGQNYVLLAWFDSAAQTLNIQVNGGTINSVSTASATPYTTSTAFAVGTASPGNGYYWNGSIGPVVFGKPPTAIGSLISAINTWANSGTLPSALTAAQIAAWGVVSGWQWTQPGSLGVDSIGSNTLTLVASPTAAAGPVLGPCTVAGESVSKWLDSSGNGNHLVQSVVANRPTYQTNVQNGKPVVRFNGTSSYMTIASFPSMTAATFATVFRITGVNGVIAAASHGTGANTGILLLGGSGGGNAQPNIRYQDGSNTQATFLANGNGTFLVTAVGAAGTNTTLIRKNGVQQATASPGALSSATNFFVVGANPDGAAAYLNGDIDEMIVYPSALSTLQLQQLEAYLDAEWAVY